MSITPVSSVQAIMFQEFDDSNGPCSKKRFQAKADIVDGVSGKHPMDTTYENTDYELLESECNPCGGMK